MTSPKKLAFAFLAAVALMESQGGEPERLLNVNSSMELGQEGLPAPGWMLEVVRFSRERAAANPDLMISTQTAPGGMTGQCMKVPVVEGLASYALHSGYMTIERDCEVEIAFDYKVEPAENAGKGNLQCAIDFRCFGDNTPGAAPAKLDNPKWPQYPILKYFSFNPSTEWKHFSQKSRAIKWHNYYELTVKVGSSDGKPLNAALLLDNFKIRISGEPAFQEEAVVAPDKIAANYFGGEKIKLSVRALLDSKAASEKLTVNLVSDTDDSVWKSLEIPLERSGERLYKGECSLKAEKFGAYHAEVSHNGAKIAALGDVTVLQPVVEHKRFSPGWSIGYNNSSSLAGYRPKNAERFEYITYRGFEGCLNRKFEIPRLAGMKTVRHWGHWWDIEPEDGQFRPELTSMALDGFTKNGIETIFCLVGDLTYLDAGTGPATAYPPYLYKYREMGINKNEIILPPMNVYGGYLDYCLKTWGKQVHIWELFNEPPCAFPPKRYLEYLKYTYPVIKRHNPEDLLLGNGATCDMGLDAGGWSYELNKIDPNYVDDLDCIAFHPYYTPLDYDKGVYGLYSKFLADFRGFLKKPKPLWNTECFYLTNARKPQVNFYVNKGLFGANEIQRHHLEGLLNDVKVSTSRGDTSFFKVSAPAGGLPVLNDSSVATNTLSFLLKGMEKLEAVKLNKFMHAGIFTDAEGRKAMGFVYDMRPSGSTIVPASSGLVGLFSGSGVKIMDLFGNELKGEKIPLSYEPCFIEGSTADVKDFFAKAKFIPNESCRIFARKFRDDIHLNAVNSTGMPCTAEIEFAKECGIPRTQFAFANDADDSEVPVGEIKAGKLADTAFTVKLDGEDCGSGKLSVIPASPCYDIAASEASAKELTLDMGTKAKVWSEGENLRIKTWVKDANIVAAPDENPWEGDAVEVFVDPFPFKHLDRDLVLSSIPLPCLQYAFGAVPSKTGVSVKGMRRGDNDFKTAAKCVQTKTSDGYCVDATIPLEELSLGSSGDILGLELEVDHHDSKTNAKESLSGVKKGQSFNFRLHYPLFKLDKTGTLRNADFTKGSYGSPDVWCVGLQSEKAQARFVEGAGFAGGPALVFDVKGKAPGKGNLMVTQKLLKPDWATGVKVGVRLRLEGVDTHGATLNSYWPQGFAISLGESDLGRQLKHSIEGDMPWTFMQYYAKLPKGTKDFQVSFGLRGGATGKAYVDKVKVEFTR